jgi:exonuclease SbcC
MRPIHLTIEGIHSFRERQQIDFQQLCSGGVFGIFGPTGSGKSTILDAITFALYGRVERAGNQLQGIMNHASDELYVEFIFELGKQCTDFQDNRYTVTRTLKRNKDNSIRTSTCRLIQATSVIADKERDVTSGIEELLGLTFDDFTRAVVLPQGKFAEFLSLKNKDRRQMLQRIFNLEQYGDKLQRKIKARIDKAASKINEIRAEQQGLGDASKEALKNTEAELKQLTTILQQKAEELKLAEGQFEVAKVIWQKQQQLITIQTEIDKQQAKLPEISELEQRLMLANQANLLKPYIEELRRIDEEIKLWSQQSSIASDEYEKTKSQQQLSLQEYKRAKEKRSQQEPSLLVKQADLTKAIEAEAKLVLELNGIKELERLFIDKEKQCRQLEEKLYEYKKSNDNSIKMRQEIEAKLQQQQVTKEWREVIRNANTDKQNLLAIATSMNELIDEENKLSQKLSKQREAAEKLKEQIDQLESQSQQQLLLEEQYIVDFFLKQLSNGVACPVCGSLEHPNKHKETSKSEVNTIKCDIDVKQLQELNNKYIKLIAEIEVHQQANQTLLSKKQKLQNTYKIEQDKWQQIYPKIPIDTVEAEQQAINTKDNEADILKERLAKSISAIELKQPAIERMNLEIQGYKIDIAKMDTELKGLKAAVTNQQQALVDITGESKAEDLYSETTKLLDSLKSDEQQANGQWEELNIAYLEAEKTLAISKESHKQATKRWEIANIEWQKVLEGTTFQSIEDVSAAILDEQLFKQGQQQVTTFYDQLKQYESQRNQLVTELAGKNIDEQQWTLLQNDLITSKQVCETAQIDKAKAERDLENIKNKHERFLVLENQLTTNLGVFGNLEKLQKAFRGNSFVEYIAEEQLASISFDASAKLRDITRHRYALEVDSQGNFVIRDDANGGVRRPVATLSGGETFLTSLALALSLSAQIQLRGQFSLEFFFLDEGFGTLDIELLELVISNLERMHSEQLSIGIISHVPELRERFAKKIIVAQASSNQGSRLYIES